MQRRQLMLLVASTAAAAILGCSNSNAGPTAEELRPLTIDEVSTRIAAKDGNTFIYDANAKESWIKGHVPTAKWIDDEHVTAADLPANKTAALIFYCHNET